jgi:uncharacterized membrane protein YgdD (TMEM256/DUF423 family)
MTSRLCIVSGAVSGFVGVAAGAFGAHGLSTKLSAKALAVWQTAAHYQLVHSVALFALGVWLATGATGFSGRLAEGAGWAFSFGVLVFSGSLYFLALTDIRGLGAITPIGGLGLLLGWALVAAAAVWGPR